MGVNKRRKMHKNCTVSLFMYIIGRKTNRGSDDNVVMFVFNNNTFTRSSHHIIRTVGEGGMVACLYMNNTRIETGYNFVYIGYLMMCSRVEAPKKRPRQRAILYK